MNIDVNNLKTIISSSKPSDRLILSLTNLEKNSYQISKKEIDKFIKKDQDRNRTQCLDLEGFWFMNSHSFVHLLLRNRVSYGWGYLVLGRNL